MAPLVSVQTEINGTIKHANNPERNTFNRISLHIRPLYMLYQKGMESKEGSAITDRFTKYICIPSKGSTDLRPYKITAITSPFLPRAGVASVARLTATMLGVRASAHGADSRLSRRKNPGASPSPGHSDIYIKPERAPQRGRFAAPSTPVRRPPYTADNTCLSGPTVPRGCRAR
jgi:hypothetical protein